MTDVASQPRLSAPPARHLRLLANLAPAATVMFALVTVWLLVSTVQNLMQPISTLVVGAVVVGLVLAVLAGLTTYRLGIEVPRVLRGWQGALAERTRVLRNR